MHKRNRAIKKPELDSSGQNQTNKQVFLVLGLSEHSESDG
jgi:hypothetical protein